MSITKTPCIEVLGGPHDGLVMEFERGAAAPARLRFIACKEVPFSRTSLYEIQMRRDGPAYVHVGWAG